MNKEENQGPNINNRSKIICSFVWWYVDKHGWVEGPFDTEEEAKIAMEKDMGNDEKKL